MIMESCLILSEVCILISIVVTLSSIELGELQLNYCTSSFRHRINGIVGTKFDFISLTLRLAVETMTSSTKKIWSNGFLLICILWSCDTCIGFKFKMQKAVIKLYFNYNNLYSSQQMHKMKTLWLINPIHTINAAWWCQ